MNQPRKLTNIASYHLKMASNRYSDIPFCLSPAILRGPCSLGFWGGQKITKNLPLLCAIIFCYIPNFLRSSLTRSKPPPPGHPSRTRSALGQKSKMSFRRGLQLPLAIEIHLRRKNTTPNNKPGKYVLSCEKAKQTTNVPIFWGMLSDFLGYCVVFTFK